MLLRPLVNMIKMLFSRRSLQILRKFARARSAVAALEFAIIMPVLVIFMLGGAEVARFVYVSRTMTNLANSLATLVAERTTALNFNDIVFDFYSTVVTSPFLLSDAASRGTTWNYDVALTMSSVIFTPTKSGCTSGCTYTGQVAWSVNSPIAAQRSCTVAPVPAADTAPPSLATLPKDAFTAGSMIVADVVYNYTPIFGSGIFSNFTIRRSFYLQPRYQTSISYTTSGFDIGYTCGTSS